jgi:hypothetical protein
MFGMRRLLTPINSSDAALDSNTAERLLSGQLPVDDAPPDARALARVIALIGAPPTEAELAMQSEAVAVLAATIRRSSVDAVRPQRTLTSKPRITQLAAAGTIGVLTLFGGLAAANALPGAAQSVASHMLAKVGVSVPSPNGNAANHPNNRGQSASHSTGASSSSSPHGKGSTISDLARNTPATGVDKGATIAGAASNGASNASADHGQAGATPDASAPFSTPPVSTPPVSAPPFLTPPVSSGPPVSTPPVPAPPVSTPRVSTPPVPTPPLPAGSGDANGGLAHQP